MRAIIVDDEPLARDLIVEYLEDVPEIQVIATCGNGNDAVGRINEDQPDLVFLDIQMPGMNGMEMLAHLDPMPPAVVFSTAFDAFAVEAFETGAVDYLLKPYSRDRFRKTIDRVLRQQGAHESADLSQLAGAMSRKDRYGDYLFVRTSKRIVPVETASLVCIEAAGDYSTIFTREHEYLCGLGIGALSDRLDPSLFIRVHRSTIIALSAIRHIVSDGHGGYITTLCTGKKVRVSRSYAGRLRDWVV